jgi:hypothetical protein
MAAGGLGGSRSAGLPRRPTRARPERRAAEFEPADTGGERLVIGWTTPYQRRLCHSATGYS